MKDFEKNKEELNAWMQWKEVCAIMKCDEPLREILKEKVTNAFRHKLGRFLSNDLKKVLYDDKVNWANEFDVGIIEKSELARTKKNYKDFTWQKIKESSDQPLDIIHGKLLGKVSIINGIAERYLKVNHPTIWENASRSNSNFKRCKKLKKAVNCKECNMYETCKDRILVSINDPLKQSDTFDNSKTIESTLHDDSDTPGSSFDTEVLERDFPKFSCTDAAILLCHIKGIALTKSSLLKFVKKSKTTVNDRLNNFIIPKLRGISNECKEASKKNLNLLICKLKKQISSEKGSQEFLLEIEQIENGQIKNDEYCE